MNNICIFGAGSVGCYLGGLLLNAGQKVTFIGRSKFQNELFENGLSLSHFKNPKIDLDSKDIQFYTDYKALSRANIILIAVKSQDTEQAARAISKIAQPDTLIVSFQNGISNVYELNKYLPNFKILRAVVPFNITGISPGHFHCGTDGNLSIENSSDQRLHDLKAAFSKSNQQVDLIDDIVPVQWGKLLVNLNNGLNALSGGPLRDGLYQPDYRRALAAVISEALEIVRGAGIEPSNFGNASADKMIKILGFPNFIYKIIMNRIVKIDSTARSSMLDDLEMGRVSEIKYLQGEIVDLADKTDKEAPYNTIILNLVEEAFGNQKSPKLSGQEICSKLGL